MPAVLITGGTGLVGKAVTRYLLEEGYQVLVLTRKMKGKQQLPGVQYFQWNVRKQEIDGTAIAKADYIIHLAGAGVMDNSWTEKYKREIRNSRTRSSELLVKGLRENIHNVKAVISASAIGWYGEDDKDLEHSAGFIETDKPARSFLGETCLLWEQSIDSANGFNVRVVKLRLGIVLSGEGGALKEFCKPLRFGIAAILGSGKQVISWIHIEDLCRLFGFCIEHEEISGSFNAVAPEPVTNKELMMELAHDMRGKFFTAVHVPKFIIKMAFGKRSIEVLKSTTVNSRKIRSLGFTFLYPSIKVAIRDLCRKKDTPLRSV
jgi:uncharacterized protein